MTSDASSFCMQPAIDAPPASAGRALAAAVAFSCRQLSPVVRN